MNFEFKKTVKDVYTKLPIKELVAIGLGVWLEFNAIKSLSYVQDFEAKDYSFVKEYEQKNTSDLEKFIFWGEYSAYKTLKNHQTMEK